MYDDDDALADFEPEEPKAEAQDDSSWQDPYAEPCGESQKGKRDELGNLIDDPSEG